MSRESRAGEENSSEESCPRCKVELGTGKLLRVRLACPLSRASKDRSDVARRKCPKRRIGNRWGEGYYVRGWEEVAGRRLTGEALGGELPRNVQKGSAVQAKDDLRLYIYIYKGDHVLLEMLYMCFFRRKE